MVNEHWRGCTTERGLGCNCGLLSLENEDSDLRRKLSAANRSIQRLEAADDEQTKVVAIREAVQEAERRTKNLSNQAVAALAGAGIDTPEKGYAGTMEVWLEHDIHKLAGERAAAKTALLLEQIRDMGRMSLPAFASRWGDVAAGKHPMQIAEEALVMLEQHQAPAEDG